MSCSFFASLCLILTLAPSALAAEPDIRLAGIVNLPGYKVALLEDSKPHHWHVLADGQRDGEIEMYKISPAELIANISWYNQNLKLAMEVKTDQPAGAMPTIVLEKAKFRSVVAIFQSLCNCTLLQHPQTPDPPFTFHSSATNSLDALHDLQIAFTNNGLVMIPDGEKFLMIGPNSAAPMLIPNSAKTKSSETTSNLQSTNSENNAQELMPPGVIDLRGADFNQVFALYAMLINHKIDSTHPFQGPVRGDFFLFTQTPLSRPEAIYSLGTLINWRGVNVVTQSDGTITAASSPR
jgi:hypothetical protein